jgi:hypothetical protein
MTLHGKPLPGFVRDLLAAPPRVGEGLNSWLYRTSRVLHPYRAEDEIVATLSAALCDQPVSRLDIERAVKNSRNAAWSPDAPSCQPRPKPWPAVNLDAKKAITMTGGGLADLWEMSPVRFENNESHAEQIIDALFPGNPLLCVGRSNREFATRSRLKWKGRLSEMALIVPSSMSSQTGLTKEGKVSEHTLSNTGERQYLVVEQDAGSLDEQSAVLLHLADKAPLVLAVFSGSKSIHGWFRCAGMPDDRLRQFFSYAVSLGADTATWTKSQFVRMPDGTRDIGTRQTTYFFDPFRSATRPDFTTNQNPANT